MLTPGGTALRGDSEFRIIFTIIERPLSTSIMNNPTSNSLQLNPLQGSRCKCSANKTRIDWMCLRREVVEESASCTRPTREVMTGV